jgi:hypothetical protein
MSKYLQATKRAGDGGYQCIGNTSVPTLRLPLGTGTRRKDETVIRG